MSNESRTNEVTQTRSKASVRIDLADNCPVSVFEVHVEYAGLSWSLASFVACASPISVFESCICNRIETCYSRGPQGREQLRLRNTLSYHRRDLCSRVECLIVVSIGSVSGLEYQLCPQKSQSKQVRRYAE